LKEARQIAVGLAKRLGREPVELGSALGRVVAEPVPAGRDIPGNPRSKWDGFALSSRDSEGAAPGNPVIVEIAHGETAAGRKPAEACSGKCFRIMTGGVLPVGADAVIAFEDAAISGEGLVLSGPLRAGAGVSAPGSEARREDILLEECDVLTPTRLALAAAAGREVLSAVRRPRVAVLATGDELRGSGRSDECASIFCNNTHLFTNLARACGAEPIELGVSPDDPEVILSRLEKVEADLVITTGGMGKGSRDFIREVWKRLGLEIHFDELNLVPGKGSALAAGNGCIYLGLPGNPWAGRIVYEEIAAPVIRSFLGLGTRGDFSLEARSLCPMTKKKGFYQAFEGILEIRKGSCDFTPGHSAHGRPRRIASLRRGLVYALLEPQCCGLAQGEPVRVKVPDFPLLTWAILSSQVKL